MYKLYRQKIKGGIAVDEIKVGEYVRTKTDKITKLIKLDKNYVIVGHEMQELQLYCKFENSNYIYANNYEKLYEKINKYITKHSFNLKELIENKDILKVKTKENAILMIGFDEKTIDIKYKEIIEEIENGEYELLEILTHEQYERNCYRLEDN